MAFGRLVKKFGILSGKVGGSVARVSAILTACARLHNFIIREDGPFEREFFEEYDSYEITPNPAAPLGMSYWCGHFNLNCWRGRRIFQHTVIAVGGRGHGGLFDLSVEGSNDH